jgi:hypothetical protein
MVLKKLIDGASGQLSALQDQSTRNLVFILCLPFVDGIFATLLVSGAIQTFSDILTVALTIFTGAGALSVLYSCADTKQEARKMVTSAAPFLIVGAILVSLVAPVFEQLIYVERMGYAAGLALLVISFKMLEVDIADKFSVPAIILTGVVLSARNLSAIAFSLEYVVPAVLTSLAAILGLYGASMLNPKNINLDYIQKGGALVLGIISVSMFGVPVPSGLSLTVFALSVVVSLRA